jgi:hypothetical protein
LDANEDDRVAGADAMEDEPGKCAAEPQSRPGGAGQDALVVGAMPRGQDAEGPERVGDGVTTLREECGDEQDDEATDE